LLPLDGRRRAAPTNADDGQVFARPDL